MILSASYTHQGVLGFPNQFRGLTGLLEQWMQYDYFHLLVRMLTSFHGLRVGMKVTRFTRRFQ